MITKDPSEPTPEEIEQFLAIFEEVFEPIINAIVDLYQKLFEFLSSIDLQELMEEVSNAKKKENDYLSLR